jgi:SAM-dependent methyltransferase
MYPSPPSDLIFRVTGQRDPDAFATSGRLNAEDVETVLRLVNRDLGDFRRVLDFGCGCGRLTRFLAEQVDPGAMLCASDIDEPAVTWLRQALPAVRAVVNGHAPPLPFEPGGFDLIIGWSVFTHLDEALQDAWLQELSRVAAPGATLLLTVHGAYNWRFFADDAPEGLRQDVIEIGHALAAEGFAHWRNDGWQEHFPDYYHTSWHLPRYVHAHWSRWFEVEDVFGGTARPTQDVVVLRR